MNDRPSEASTSRTATARAWSPGSGCAAWPIVRAVPAASATTPSSAPARAHPTTYVVCEQDRALPPPAQEQMAAAADRVERLPSSHQPMLSMPDELATVLARVS